MRASGASELEHFHNYIHLPMQFLTITNTKLRVSTNLTVIALVLGMNVPLPLGICPLLYFP